NALDFGDIRLRECMVPRTEILAVEINSGIQTLTRKFIDSGYSKIFVYKDNIDQIVGYVRSHDLFKSPASVKNMLRKTLIVPETMLARDMLTLFIKENKSIAVVVDEFGGTSGIVSIEDLLEEIFGEIEDEYDTVDIVEKKLPGGAYVFSGKIEIDYLNEKYDFNLKVSDEYETLAGYILYLHGSFPDQGEIISDTNHQNLSFQILRAGDTRIELVKIMKTQ
ncbi:MAG: hemolysin family protein, partial [Bacteroidota bacterium]